MTSSGAEQPARSSALPPTSYFKGALATPANRIAACVTLLVALPVFAFSQVPLSPGFEVDLRDPGFSVRTRVSLHGFGPATPTGRRIEGDGPVDRSLSVLRDASSEPEARVVLNRPLPEHFTLLLEGSGQGGRRSEAVAVQIGERVYRVSFGRRVGTRRIEVRDAGPTRVLTFREAPASPEAAEGVLPAVVLRRLMLE